MQTTFFQDNEIIPNIFLSETKFKVAVKKVKTSHHHVVVESSIYA